MKKFLIPILVAGVLSSFATTTNVVYIDVNNLQDFEIQMSPETGETNVINFKVYQDRSALDLSGLTPVLYAARDEAISRNVITIEGSSSGNVATITTAGVNLSQGMSELYLRLDFRSGKNPSKYTYPYRVKGKMLILENPITQTGDPVLIGELYFATAAQGTLSDTALQTNDVGSAAFAETNDFATAAQGILANTALQTNDVGSAAFASTNDFATAAQGTLSDTALQTNDVGSAAFASTNDFVSYSVDNLTAWDTAAGGVVVHNAPLAASDHLSVYKYQSALGDAVLVENFDNADLTGRELKNDVDGSLPYASRIDSIVSGGKFSYAKRDTWGDPLTYLYKASWGTWDQTTSFTMSAWIKDSMSYALDWAKVLSIVPDNGTRLFELYKPKLGNLQFRYNGLGTIETPIAANVWYYVTISYDPQSRTFFYFLNGDLLGTHVSSDNWTFTEGISTTNAKVDISRGSYDNGYFWIDDFVLILNGLPITQSFNPPTTAYGSGVPETISISPMNLTTAEIIESVNLATTALQTNDVGSAAFAETSDFAAATLTNNVSALEAGTNTWNSAVQPGDPITDLSTSGGRSGQVLCAVGDGSGEWGESGIVYHKVDIPYNFYWKPTVDFELYTKQSGEGLCLIDTEELQFSTTNNFYVDPAGDDSSGLSWSNAFHTIPQAVAAATGTNNIYVKAGVYSSVGTSGTTTNVYNFFADGGRVQIIPSVTMGAWSNISSGTYSAVASSGTPWNVADLLNTNAYGFERMRLASDLATCQSTPASFFISGTTVSVHLVDGRNPDSNVYVTSESNCMSIGGTGLYVEGFDFVGGKGFISSVPGYGSETFLSLSKPRQSLVDCRGIQARNASAFNIRNYGETYVIDCEAYGAELDGFNYHNISSNTEDESPKALEYNCIGSNNGWDGPSDQGSTAHDVVRLIRVNGTYNNNYTTEITDINPSCRVLNIGCVVVGKTHLYGSVQEWFIGGRYAQFENLSGSPIYAGLNTLTPSQTFYDKSVSVEDCLHYGEVKEGAWKTYYGSDPSASGSPTYSWDYVDLDGSDYLDFGNLGASTDRTIAVEYRVHYDARTNNIAIFGDVYPGSGSANGMAIYSSYNSSLTTTRFMWKVSSVLTSGAAVRQHPEWEILILKTDSSTGDIILLGPNHYLTKAGYSGEITPTYSFRVGEIDRGTSAIFDTDVDVRKLGIWNRTLSDKECERLISHWQNEINAIGY